MATEDFMNKFAQRFGGQPMESEESEENLDKPVEAQMAPDMAAEQSIEDSLKEPQSVEEGLNAIALENQVDARNGGVVLGDSPTNPVPVSPVGLLDRAAIAVGNEKGNISKLKKDFKDAKYSPEQGLVVLTGEGKWHSVDPTNLGGNAWDLTEAIADTLEFASSEAVPTALSVVGGVNAGPAGLIGGDVAGRYINMNLGRLYGTYDATPEEMVADLTWEAVAATAGLGIINKVPAARQALKSGGRKVAETELFREIAERPTIKAMTNAFKHISEVAHSTVREGIEGLLSAGTGVNKRAAKGALTRPGELNANLNKFLRSGSAKTGEEVSQAISDEAIRQQTVNLQTSRKALSKVWRTREAELLKDPGLKDFSVNPSEITKNFMQPLEGVGALKSIKNKAGQTVGYRMSSEKELETLLTGGGEANVPFLRKKAQRALERFVKDVNPLVRKQSLTGASGAEQALKIRRAYRDTLGDLYKSNPELRGVLGPEAQGVVNKFSEAFTKNKNISVGTKYNRLNDFYSRNVDFVEEAERVVRKGAKGTNIRSVENFNNKLFSDKDTQTREVFDAVSNVHKEAGSARRAQRVLDLNTTQQFTKKFPHFSDSKISLGSAAANVAKAAVSPAFSPRVDARLIGQIYNGQIVLPTLSSMLQSDPLMARLPYLKKMRDSVGLMQQSTKDDVLRDPNKFNALMAPVMEGPEVEKQGFRELLQQSGVIPSGQ